MPEANGIRLLDSGRYQARYRFAPGPRGTRTASFAGRREAKAWLVSQQAAVAGGVAIDPRQSRLLVADYWADWYGRQWRWTPNTRQRYGRDWANMLSPTFGHLRLVDVQADTVERWQARMLATYAPSTVAGAQALLSQMMKTAVRDGRVAANHVGLVAAPSVSREVIDAPHADAVAALFAHAPAHVAIVLHLALGAGLRSGEARGLTVDRIDFARGVLTIDRQLLRYPSAHDFGDAWHHGRDGFGPPKGRKRQRHQQVPVDPVLVAELERHLRLRGPGPQGLVVTARRGGPMGRGSWDNEWAGLRAAAGLALEWGGVHQLRHAYVSWHLDAGEYIADVSANVGHGRTSFTHDRYARPNTPRPLPSLFDRIAREPRVVRALPAR
ncbi:MAG: tyrosine-type recombinase/integrase [Acidimicrobiales bacterium]